MYRGWVLVFFQFRRFFGLPGWSALTPPSPLSCIPWLKSLPTYRMQTIKCVVVGDGAVGKVRSMLPPYISRQKLIRTSTL